MSEGAACITVEVVDWTHAAERARAVRHAVFILEQHIPAELEWDELDAVSRHALARDQTGTVVGAGRLLPDGRIGRMAVLKEWRGRGVGRAVLAALEAEAGRRGMTELSLHAQVDAEGFYARNGYRSDGREFVEAGIRHVTMHKSRAAAPAGTTRAPFQCPGRRDRS
ncbi:MAG: GNAT family N-acetyltransferase [Betaproteobacteria bacterium]|nr:GNAT family N-acetyltransferase [Betaproteobacteria bacterium]